MTYIFATVQGYPCSIVIFEVTELEHFHAEIKEPSVLVTWVK